MYFSHVNDEWQYVKRACAFERHVCQWDQGTPGGVLRSLSLLSFSCVPRRECRGTCPKQRRVKRMPWGVASARCPRAAPRRRAGKPESWVPLTLVPSERWCHWCTPTGSGSCCRRPAHLKHIYQLLISQWKRCHWLSCPMAVIGQILANDCWWGDEPTFPKLF